MTVYDMLDIDETEGIDPTEIAAIKDTITRIKVAAAGVAKHNDTTDTLLILKEMERMIRQVANSGVHSIDELHQQFAVDNTGQPARALGASSSDNHEVTPEQALQVLMQHLEPGQTALLRRLTLPPGNSNRVNVDHTGDDERIDQLRQELTTTESKYNTAWAMLSEIVLHLGLSAPSDNAATFPTDTVQKVKEAVADKVAEAGNSSTPNDSIAKDDLKAIVENPDFAKIGDIKSSGMAGTNAHIKGGDAEKIKESFTKLNDLVS